MSVPTIALRIEVTDSELTCLIESLERGGNTAADLAERRSLLLKITAALEKLDQADDLPRTG